MKNYQLRTTVLSCLLGMLIIVYSCQRDEIGVENQNQFANSGVAAKANKTKVDICHKGKVINVNFNAVSAHKGHGDAVDLDGDGYFDIENSCTATDCDDSNPAINPSVLEIIYNGIDDDCDPGTLDDDLDGDGFMNANDCDDSDPMINPDAEEVCENGIDDDCDGEIDEDCVVLPDPIAFYPFNGNADDESGNGNNGTVNGATLTFDRFGNSNSAFSFDGVDDYVQIPSASENVLGSSNFTVSVWINSSTTDEGVIWNKRNSSSCSSASGPTTGFSQTSASNGNTLKSRVRSSSDYLLYSQVSLSDGNWHNALLVREGNNMTLYLDGQVQQIVSIASGINFATTLDLFIGKTVYCSGNHFEGLIDDFSIYDVALNQDQINQLNN